MILPLPTTHPLLETISSPSDLRKLPREQLKTVADELRAYLLDSVSKTGPFKRG
jgi:1-deoxy-D-xylulose-5-phosphate synthase